MHKTNFNHNHNHDHNHNYKKNSQETILIQKPIYDSGFHHKVFANKTHDHTPYNNSITYSWFLTLYYLIFNPAHAPRELRLQLVSNLTHPPFMLWKVLNLNPWWYNHDYSKQLTYLSRSRPISSKRPIAYLRKTCLVSFKTSFGHSSSFDFPPLY